MNEWMFNTTSSRHPLHGTRGGHHPPQFISSDAAELVLDSPPPCPDAGGAASPGWSRLTYPRYHARFPNGDSTSEPGGDARDDRGPRTRRRTTPDSRRTRAVPSSATASPARDHGRPRASVGTTRPSAFHRALARGRRRYIRGTSRRRTSGRRRRRWTPANAVTTRAFASASGEKPPRRTAPPTAWGSRRRCLSPPAEQPGPTAGRVDRVPQSPMPRAPPPPRPPRRASAPRSRAS